MESKRKQENGITIIALVVTTVLLLMLAGITLSVILGNGGILPVAKSAADKTNEQIKNETEGLQNLGQWTNEVTSGNSTRPYEDPNAPKEAVARLNGNYYSTVQEAINNVSSNNLKSTIYLLKDTTEHVTISENKNVELELGNHKINWQDENYATISSKGMLNIKNGLVSSEKSNVITNNGVLAIENGTQIIGSNYKNEENQSYPAVVNRENATMTMSGAEIVGQTGSAIWNKQQGNLTITEGTVKANESCAINNEGIINKISGVTISSEKSNCINNYGTIEDIGGKVELIGSTYKTEKNETFPILLNQANARVNITGGTFTATSGTAVQNQQQGNVSIIGGNLKSTLNYTVVNNGTISQIGGNSYITGTTPICNNGTIEKIDGGTITTESGNCILNNGIVSIAGGAKITGNSENSNPTLINKANATMNINGGTITGKAGSAVLNQSQGNLTIAGGNLAVEKSNTIYNSGKATIQGDVKITGSNYKTEAGEAYPVIMNAESAVMDIQGGNITGGAGSAVFNKSQGILTITGGRIEGTSSNAISNQGLIAEINGTANISAETNNTIYNLPTGNITIKGGTIINTSENYAVYNNGGTAIYESGEVGNKNF